MEKIVHILANIIISSLETAGKFYILGKKQKHEIEKLVEDTVFRAAMAGSRLDLHACFVDKHRLGELVSHHSLKDIPKSEAIDLFLGPGSDEVAVKFVANFYDELTRILAVAEESYAARRALDYAEEIKSDVEAIRKQNKVQKLDEEAQIALLEKVVNDIESGKLDVEGVSELIRQSKGDLVTSYLKTYMAICSGLPADFDTLATLQGNNELALHLSSVALSAGRLKELREALNLCDFDTQNLYQAACGALNHEKTSEAALKVEIPDLETSSLLIGLINFEFYIKHEAYQPAIIFVEDNAVLWNPLAREEYAVVKLIEASSLSHPTLLSQTIALIRSYQDWFPDSLISLFKRGIDQALRKLSVYEAYEAIDKIPSALEEFAQDEIKRVELRECDNVDSALEIAIWAEARKNQELLIEASVKILTLDESKRSKLSEIFACSKRWLFADARFLDFYVSELNPSVSYEQYENFGKGHEEDSIYHVVAYKAFYKQDLSLAEEHMETALSLMKRIGGSIDLGNVSVWVSYLIEKSRDAEALELLEDAVPNMLLDSMRVLIGSLDSSEKSRELLMKLALSAVNKDFYDPRAAECVASFLVHKEKITAAGRIARRAFRRMPSETLAAIALQWFISSSLKIEKEILRYAEDQDTARLDILLSEVARLESDIQRSSAYLIRSIFNDSGFTESALSRYAMLNAGSAEECSAPQSVDADTCVVLTDAAGEKKIFIFLSNAFSVRDEGASCKIGAVYSTQSSEFIRCRGCRVGEKVSLEGKLFTISEMISAQAYLMKSGFEELGKSPGSVVFEGDIDETLDALEEFMKSESTAVAFYNAGLKIENEIVYWGIESGGLIKPDNLLEFVIKAVCSSLLSYRRYPTYCNIKLPHMCTFLLSYNSLVVLSLLGISEDIADAISSSCVITESTAARLERDVEKFVDEPFSAAGRLAHDGERLIFYENNETSQQSMKEIGLPLLSLLRGLRVVEPVLYVSNCIEFNILTDNEVIDIETAKAHNYIYVTEDYLEARLIDIFQDAKRCSLTALLSYFGYKSYILDGFASQMKAWGATPIIEADFLLGSFQ